MKWSLSWLLLRPPDQRYQKHDAGDKKNGAADYPYNTPGGNTIGNEKEAADNEKQPPIKLESSFSFLISFWHPFSLS